MSAVCESVSAVFPPYNAYAAPASEIGLGSSLGVVAGRSPRLSGQSVLFDSITGHQSGRIALCIQILLCRICDWLLGDDEISVAVLSHCELMIIVDPVV